ncbi:MAG: hypothetical protein CME43_08085 [Haliea sp.]|jgi:hypothetical protein|uniref:hypothetical protein n=1 Tax=Haliea sp. TaxID=1932666 RepID=UPI000C5702B6|nr:hypothetical protein [Haliea sp.]MBM69420.1 hypothetical protein [Haliea sp.]|tara:strand:- start:72346 stop:72942 length:597 start_codon:yes stop_codon:yes gene_type:complete
MKIIVPLLALLLAACQAGAGPTTVAGSCDLKENLLANPGFVADEASGSLRPWSGSQHAGERSFTTEVNDGVLTIEKIATQPWFKFSQAPRARALRGEQLLFQAEFKLALDTDEVIHGFKRGGGAQILIWGDPDPVMGGDRLMLDSTLEHEPHLGQTDWFTVRIPVSVPATATRMNVGFVHQANGVMQVRNPGLYRCAQ